MNWKKVSEHPLPEGDGNTLYVIKREDGNIDGIYLKPRSIPLKKNIIEWCEFNPDEIESADSLDVPSVLKRKTEYKSATEVMGEFRAKQEAAMNQALFAKRMIEELSWEEKFRWETARQYLTARSRDEIYHSKNIFEESIDMADRLIAELKRGRE